MFVILSYDVETKRNRKVLKTCRRYLIHAQKSVFEGYISERQLVKLKNELAKLIDFEMDQIALYEYNKGNTITKEVIGYYVVNDNVL